MYKHLDSLFQREMSRKEFLTTLGFGLAAVFGFSTLIKLVTGKDHHGGGGPGYGSRTYGDKR